MTVKTGQNSIEQISYFEKSFADLEDPRRTTKGNFHYPLNELLFLVISAVVSGAEEWTTIESFGCTKLEWLRRFLPYKNGIPSHDVLGKVFSRIDPIGFNACFTNWINTVSDITKGEVVAIDGKTIRGSGDSEKPKSAVHVVSAYAAENRLCLGQTTVDQKSNEIVAIPKVLELLAIKGCVVTIDAMGCQKELAANIIEKKADYVLMVKDNQKGLKMQIEKMFNHHQKDCPKDETVDAGHGRIETRLCEVIDDLTFMDNKEQWKQLKSIVKVTSRRYEKKSGKESIEIRYYIASLKADPAKLNHIIRSHWRVENNLHWTLDVLFNEDKSLKKKDNAAANFNIINKIALTLIEREKSMKISKKRKRLTAALDDRYREKILKS